MPTDPAIVVTLSLVGYAALILYYIVRGPFTSTWWATSRYALAALAISCVLAQLAQIAGDNWTSIGAVAFVAFWMLFVSVMAYTSYTLRQIHVLYLIPYHLLLAGTFALALIHEALAAIILLPVLIITPLLATWLHQKFSRIPIKQPD